MAPTPSQATAALLVLILPKGIQRKRNGSFCCKKLYYLVHQVVAFMEEEAFAIKMLWIAAVLHKWEKLRYCFCTADFFLISSMMGKRL